MTIRSFITSSRSNLHPDVSNYLQPCLCKPVLEDQLHAAAAPIIQLVSSVLLILLKSQPVAPWCAESWSGINRKRLLTTQTPVSGLQSWNAPSRSETFCPCLRACSLGLWTQDVVLYKWTKHTLKNKESGNSECSFTSSSYWLHHPKLWTHFLCLSFGTLKRLSHAFYRNSKNISSLLCYFNIELVWHNTWPIKIIFNILCSNLKTDWRASILANESNYSSLCLSGSEMNKVSAHWMENSTRCWDWFDLRCFTAQSSVAPCLSDLSAPLSCWDRKNGTTDYCHYLLINLFPNK